MAAQAALRGKVNQIHIAYVYDRGNSGMAKGVRRRQLSMVTRAAPPWGKVDLTNIAHRRVGEDRALGLFLGQVEKGYERQRPLGSILQPSPAWIEKGGCGAGLDTQRPLGSMPQPSSLQIGRAHV